MRRFETYETHRLRLKLFDENDADFLFELYNSPSFIKFIGNRNIRNTCDARNYIKERFLPQIKKLGFGNYLIILKESNQKIGAVGIFGREGLDVMDIGFSFLPEFESKGYGYESSKRILQAGFEDFNLENVSAITLEDNIASRKLIEKLGLKFKKIINIPNDPEDLLYYEISKEQFENL